MASTLRIEHLAKKVGLSASTLRNYELIGILAPAKRTPSGRRIYSEGDVRRVELMLRLRRLGLSLDEAKQIVDYRLDESLASQTRLRDLVSKLRLLERIDDRLAELAALRDELRGAVA